MFLTIQRSTVGFSNAAFPFVFPSQSFYPAFFISESRSRLIFSFEFLAFTIQCLRLTFLQQGALMFKVLDVAISDRSFIFCFAYLFILFIYLFIYSLSTSVQNRRFTSISVLAILKQPVELGYIDVSISLLLDSIRLWRQLSTLTTGHGKCVWTQWLHRLIECSLLYGNINLVWNRTAQPNANNPHAESLLFHPSRTWSSILV